MLTDAEEMGIIRPQTALKDKLINLRLRLKEGIATSALVKAELRAILPLLEAASAETKTSTDFWRVGPFARPSSKPLVAPDGSPQNPFHFVQSSGKIAAFTNLVWLIVLCAIVYSIFSSARSGAGGEAGLLGMGREEPTQVQNPTTTFKDVIGDEEAKEDLTEIVQFLTNPGKFTDMKARLPRGVLLTGPPGCGKTLLARALAGEAGVPFLVASGAEFEEMFVGVGARRVRKLFKRAKELAPCVIFIDEIDVIGGDRDAAEFRRTRMTLQQLLVEMDGFDQNSGIVVVAATNFPDILDPALTRSGRFDRKVAVRLPDLKARQGILKLYLGEDFTNEPELDRLAKSSAGFSGADLSNMVNAARVEAARRGAKALDFDLLAWARDMVSMGRERRFKARSEWELQLVAYHESGHALSSLYVPGARPLDKITIVPRNNSGGHTAFQHDDEEFRTREQMFAELVTSMGGRVAEEIIFGPDKITQGAGMDFKQATDIAQQMVTKLGMSDKVGKSVYRTGSKGGVAPATQEVIDTEVRGLLEDAYSVARKNLVTHTDELHRLAKSLLERETLSGDEIRQVISEKSATPSFFDVAKASNVRSTQPAPAVPTTGAKLNIPTPLPQPTGALA